MYHGLEAANDWSVLRTLGGKHELLTTLQPEHAPEGGLLRLPLLLFS